MTTTFLTIVLSALGGAVGALLLRSLLKLVGKFWAERKPLAVYDCADDTQRPGGFWHGSGIRQVNDPLATNKRSWEHTPTDPSTDHPHTVYGLYVNDFGRPGYYRVRFRIYGSGFESTEDPVVVVDVVQRPIFLRDQLIVLGQRVIKGKELSSEYRYFDVYCYATGSGTYEYRCLVHSEAFDANQQSIRFDVIKVFMHMPSWELL